MRHASGHIIIGTVRSLIVDVTMGQIPRSTEGISSLFMIQFCFCTTWQSCLMTIVSS